MALNLNKVSHFSQRKGLLHVIEFKKQKYMTKAQFLSRCQDGLQYVQSGNQTPEQVLIVIQQMLDEHQQLLQQTQC